MPNRHIIFLFNYGGVHDLYIVEHIMYMYMCVFDVNNHVVFGVYISDIIAITRLTVYILVSIVDLVT